VRLPGKSKSKDNLFKEETKVVDYREMIKENEQGELTFFRKGNEGSYQR